MAVRIISITADQQGQRIDNFLLRELKGVPKTHIYKLLRKGEVRVNGGRIKPVYRLQSGDQVRIPPVRVSPAKTDPTPSEGLQSSIKQAVLYEDGDFLVINKPAGLAVHGGSGVALGLIESLRAIYPHAKRLELVHRLDRETSGCILVAKKTSILREFHQMIREDRLEKRYHALMHGQLGQRSRHVEVALRKNTLSSGERVVRVDRENGKASKTVFHVQEQFKRAFLADIELFTGRTHQIRVHAQHIQHPVVGDSKYGDEQADQWIKNKTGNLRLCLHASRLRFQHPKTAEPFEVEAPWDSRFQQVLDGFRA